MASALGSIEQYGAEAATAVGAVNGLTQTSRERIDTAENIAIRLRDLRMRLVGESERGVNEVCGSDAPSPVRSEVEELEHTMEVMRRVLEDAMNELSQLERL